MPTSGPNPFDVLITESQGLEQLNELTKKCFHKLLETIEKVSEYESGAIVENCRADLQSHEVLAENMRLKALNKKYLDEVSRLQELANLLSVEKSNLTIRLIKKGDYQLSSQALEKTSENVEEIKNERDMFREMLNEETKKNTRTKFQQEVSNERVVQSRAFKTLIHQAKSLKKKLESYKDRIESLNRYKDEFNEMMRKETGSIMQKEEEKRDALAREIKGFQAKIVQLEREKSQAVLEVESLRALSKERKPKENNWHELVDCLSKDKENLKTQNLLLKQKNQEISKKLEELELKKLEPSSETEVVKLQKLVEDYRQKLKSEHQTTESLIAEIEVTGNAYENLEGKNKSLTFQLAEQENLYNKLLNEKLKESSWRTVHDEERKAYEKKIESLEKVIKSHENLHKEYENQLSQKQSFINNLEQKCKEIESKIKLNVENSEESLMRFQEIIEYRKDYMASLKKSEDVVAKMSQDKLDLNLKLEECKKSLASLEEKYKKEMDLTNLKSADELLNAEVAQYRVRDM